MQLWIGVWLPRLALDVLPPSLCPSEPSVVLQAERVYALDEAARAAGIALGMRRAGVMALAPAARILARDPVREADLLRAVGVALMAFTPQAVFDDDTILLNVGTSLRLFGGIRALRRRVRATLANFGVTGCCALAPTGAAAHLLARAGGRGALTWRALDRALQRVSLAALVAARDAAWLTELGCATVADVRRLPRAGLSRRCGPALVAALDRITGEAPEAYEWHQVPPAFDTRIELPDRVEHAEAVLFPLRRLVLQLIGWLAAQHLAIVRLGIALEHERGRCAIAPTDIDIALAEPATQEAHVMRLVRERITRTPLPAAVMAVRLLARELRVREAVSDVLFLEPGGTPQDHARLLELLIARCGAEHVLAPAPVADYRPEVAARWAPVHQVPPAPPAPPAATRPVWLLPAPIALIMRGHRPFYGTPLRVLSSGERVECGWYDGHVVLRDYFVAQSEQQVCYWLYRERVTGHDASPRWFLHGLFG